MNLTDLSKFLENIYSKKGMNDVLEYVDVEQLVAKFSQLIPTMNIHEYKSFILKEKLEEELISNNFKSSKPKL
jgi:hypothetical protein